MGSDEAKKRRDPRDAWIKMGATLLAVIFLLSMAQYQAMKPRAVVVVSKRTPVNLKSMLLEIARLPPMEALAALDRDPLGVENASATEWNCPESRIERGLPSAEAEGGLRRGDLGHFLWFEHLSKAGGTSFCDFARKNVGHAKTPSYYCMPSDGPKKPDGRVGRWQAGKLDAYVKRTGHVVVANEWDAFPAHLFQGTRRSVAVLAAVVRDPVDRLVSAYKFWGKLHNPNPNPKKAPDWLADRDRLARRSPHRLDPDNFLSQVARNNFAVWKFSSSQRPEFDDCRKNVTCELAALELAMDRVAQFHVAVPMLWQHAAKPLYERLGWTKTDPVHKVPSGKIQNSDAKKELGGAFHEFRALNVFDYVLWAYIRRLFLERVHCPRPPPP